MKTDELREKYLAFFEGKGHARRPSDVLVPTWDPSVLFTPAGMNQFKDHFLGKVKLDFTRATTSQKCLRTGDIDNVGRTAYHHTFFEMLGNFSFGDYFKREAIHWAWEFLTDKQWLALNPAQLSVTVYLDDDEAFAIWRDEIGLPENRIVRMDEDENFWPASAPSQGPDGVCGPCSEIYFHPPSGKEVEIWNLVFTQFNRVGDPPDNLRPLPSRNIDTGMGLERCAAVLQGLETNYHIDSLIPLVRAAAEACGVAYEPDSDNGRRLRRIADHVRACVFAVHENVYPGAKAEKYVIRRLLRRAVLDGHQMGRRDPFLCHLVPVVVDLMKAPYPELTQTVERVEGVIRHGEEEFLANLDAGLERIDKIFHDMQADGRTVIPGEAAADLYQTFGVPPELTETMGGEQGLTFDWDGFRAAMDEHTRRAGGGGFDLFKTGPIERLKGALEETEFVGYAELETEVVVKGLIVGDETVDAAQTDEEMLVVLDRSPFYGESGGQVGDTGRLAADGVTFEVLDTQKDGGLFLHRGRLSGGTIKTGATLRAEVDMARRQAIRRAHSATHMLHHALQQHLGTHAQQQGSKVEADQLRFDFTHLEPIAQPTLAAIQDDVVARVGQAAPIDAQVLPLAEAREAGAMMLFGERYPDNVRMISMGDFSKELCGGTHLSNTSEVLAFEITGEEGVAAGVRRVTALTGEKAQAYSQRMDAALQEASACLNCPPHEVALRCRGLMNEVRDWRKAVNSGVAPQPPDPAAKEAADPNTRARDVLREAARMLNASLFETPARLEALLEERARLQRQFEQLESSGAVSADSLLEEAAEVAGVPVVIRETPGANPNLMRQWIDQLRKKTGSIAVLLTAAAGDEKVVLVAGVTHDLIERGLRAGDWVKAAAGPVGGGGGGKPDMAQAGGKQPAKIGESLEAAAAFVKQQLAEA